MTTMTLRNSSIEVNTKKLFNNPQEKSHSDLSRRLESGRTVPLSLKISRKKVIMISLKWDTGIKSFKNVFPWQKHKNWQPKKNTAEEDDVLQRRFFAPL